MNRLMCEELFHIYSALLISRTFCLQVPLYWLLISTFELTVVSHLATFYDLEVCVNSQRK